MRIFAVATSLLLGLSAAASTAQPGPSAPQGQRPAGVGVTVRDLPSAQRMPHSYDLSDGHIMFQATIGGIDVWVLLDNGADRSLVDIAMVDTSGVNPGRPDRIVRTPSGDLPSVLVSPVPMMIPGQLEIRSPFFAIDMAAFSKTMQHPVDAIFGGDLLGHVEIRVDSHARTFELVPSGTTSASEALPFIPLKDAKGQLEMMIGDKPVLVTLDLGSNSALSLTPAAWARVGPRNQKLQQSTSRHADGKAFLVDVGMVPAASLGAVKREKVAVSVRPWPTDYVDGIVGMGFLTDLDFTLDITARKLWLRPRTTPS